VLATSANWHTLLPSLPPPPPPPPLPQLYIKVPGVWTGGHEEACRFRSVNCCHGPGASEWGAIEGRHAPRLRELVLAEFGVDIYRSEGEW
jgi:hypothetical protein